MKHIALAFASCAVCGSLSAMTFSTDHDLTAAEAATLKSTNEDLIVSGGILTVGQSLAGWSGNVTIKSGARLKATVPGALGNATGTTTVENGGTFEFTFKGEEASSDDTGAKSFQNEKFFVEGSGTDGKGCILYTGSEDNAAASLGKVTLTGDATFGPLECPYRWDIRNQRSGDNGGYLDMAGHDLLCNAKLGLTCVKLKNAGTITVNNTYIYFENPMMRFENCETGKIVLGDHSLAFQAAPPIPMAIEVDGGRFAAWSPRGEDAEYSAVSGPVTIGSKGLVIASNARCMVTISGKISGPGKITLKTNDSLVGLLNDANDFTGGLTIENNVRLVTGSEGALPGYDVPDRNAMFWGTVVCRMPGWSPTAYATFSETVTRGNVAAAVIVTAEGENAVESGVVPAEGAYPFLFDSTLPLTLTGLGSTWAGLYVRNGELIVSPTVKTSQSQGLSVVGGQLSLVDSGYVATTTNRPFAAAAYPSVARIKIAGETTVNGLYLHTRQTENSTPKKDAYAPFFLGYSTDKTMLGDCLRGILEVCEGATVSNRFVAGFGTDLNTGSIYQRGGSYYSKNASSEAETVGSYATGYYEISGGEAKFDDWFHIGGGSRGHGEFRQTGGTVDLLNSAHITLGHLGSTGQILLSGGSFTSVGEVHIPKSIWDETGKGASVGFTVDGTAEVTVRSFVDLASQSNSVGRLNLNGGVLAANTIVKIHNQDELAQPRVDAKKSVPFVGNTAYVNFNGGTLKARNDTYNTPVNNAKPHLFKGEIDRITVFAGGATIDTDGNDRTIAEPLQAPSGNGIASIPWTNAYDDWEFIAPPRVTITDPTGTGAGADAVADFDSVNGRVTGITVTSPGCNYSAETTVTIDRGGQKSAIVVTPVLAPMTSGGLVKKGAGTLTLAAANTYAGATRVEAGTLKLAEGGSIASSAAVELAGGTLDLNGQEQDFATLTASAGALTGGRGTIGTLTKTEAGTLFLDAPYAIGSVDVRAGTLKLPSEVAGLIHGWANANNTVRAQRPVFTNGGVVSSFEEMHIGLAETGFWAETDKTATWSGAIWNDSNETKTWTFAANMDDGVVLMIDGVLVPMTRPADNTGWGVPFCGTVTVAPGPHKFYFLAYNVGGAGGIPGSGKGWTGWPQGTGFAFNPNGTDTKNWADGWVVIDAVGGPRFTKTTERNANRPTIDAISFAAETTLDLDGGAWTLPSAVAGLPAAVNGSVTLPLDATWTLTAAEVLKGACTAVAGQLTFDEPTTIVLDTVVGLDREATYEIATATKIEGLPKLVDSHGNPPGGWRVKVAKGGTALQIVNAPGLLVIFR